ncbi:MAG: NADPH-dependent assimilatory sulfite reductase hemoprotein subunit [Verrucomicrobia bacterium]|nr:NADPH-dependent assimilatory sulfite reductase hemoprotein subunit [Verrucomicrobiota bacterium]MDA0904970.1 NADPH-dependent assimilatory sulfite reductase hemoprotein subunit [Verrucomicrobiota bacterium]MDA1077859.1 NADPH-dependent assimilatory sulfite reductase hemoprotein subunit [Verrucomicrobiota bacterium]
MISDPNSPKKLSANEGIKERSNFLRGTILESLSDESTGSISADDAQLTKFHGTYMQDDRDKRASLIKEKKEKAYSFMIRVRVPGGVCTPAQWLGIDELADKFGESSLKLTTRQAFQLYGILKKNLKQTMKEINDTLLDTLAACGDVNRNVMSPANPFESKLHQQALDVAQQIHDHLTPKTSSYAEIWLDGEKKGAVGEEEEEPIYGKTYLPRKFKIAVALPPRNDVDVFSNCLGFVGIPEGDKVIGYNVLVGGGLGMTHGKTATYPRLADVIGFCSPEQVVQVAEEIVKIQRDHGDRSDRRHARMKYTVEDKGPDWILEELNRRLGWSLEKARDFEFDSTTDRYGWTQDADGKWAYGLFVEGGRLRASGNNQGRLALRKIAEEVPCQFRLTANQNVIIARVDQANKQRVEDILRDFGVTLPDQLSGIRLNSIACTALPTCSLALAESERYLPKLVDELETIIDGLGLRDQSIAIRSTGCPNGCGRPYLGEIGLVGKAPGKYNLYLGAGLDGTRLNKLYRPAISHEEIVQELTPVLEDFASNRETDERFGDFCIRQGYVQATLEGSDFHD